MTSAFGKALAGAGLGLTQSGLMAYKSQLEAAREERLAALQEARDKRLFGQQKELETERYGHDLTARGMEINARKELETERYGHELTARGMEINARSELTDKEIEARKAIVEKQEAGANARSWAANARADKELGLRQQEFDIKKRIADLELQNVAEINRLRQLYRTAPPSERPEIANMISVLSGKPNDNWIVTGIDPDPLTGRPTAFIKTNKSTGEDKLIDIGSVKNRPAGKEQEPDPSFLERLYKGDDTKKGVEKPGRASKGLIQRGE